MVLPSQSGQKARRSDEIPQSPLPGFFQNALKVNLRTLFNKQSLPPLLLVCFFTALTYFFGNTDFSLPLPGFTLLMPAGWMILIFSTLFLLWYSMRVVSEIALGITDLPDFECNSVFDFFWSLIRDSYFFLVAVLLSFLPFSLLSAAFESVSNGSGRWMLLPGFLLFPAKLLLLTQGADLLRLFRYDLIFKWMRRHFRAYLLAVFMGGTALLGLLLGLSLTRTPDQTAPALMAAECLLKVVSTIWLLAAMRVIGLLGYHYWRTLPELWSTD